jgi:hypothetical protein
MKSISSFLNRFYYFIKGKWVVTTHSNLGYNNKIFSAIINGVKVEFFCQDIVYVKHFHKWYIPDKVIRTYRYSSRVDDEAPEYIRDKCKQVVYLPDFSPRFLNVIDKKKHMLNVYLDIINLKVAKS